MSQMAFISFGEPNQQKFKYVILIKNDGLDKHLIEKFYIDPLIAANTEINKKDFLVLNLLYKGKKAPVKDLVKPWLDELQPVINQCGAEWVICADSVYFKVLAGVKKTTNLFGSKFEAVYKGYEGVNLVLCPSHKSVFFDPKNADKITLSIAAMAKYTKGEDYFEYPITNAQFPIELSEIRKHLKRLVDIPELTVDIEAYSLKHYLAGIGTISFAESENAGIAFSVEHVGRHHRLAKDATRVITLKKWLKQFFIARHKKGYKNIFHNFNYDAKVALFELFMDGSISNRDAITEALPIFSDFFEDTKIIAYLATNSCSGNDLSLKYLSLPFLGNYSLGEDIKDINEVPRKKLLKYNLEDTCATWYVYNTYKPIMLNDEQEEIYETILKPSAKVMLQAELTGMPLNMDKVKIANKKLLDLRNKFIKAIHNNKYVRLFNEVRNGYDWAKINNEWKTKSSCLEDHDKERFNPNSDPSLQVLFYSILDLPVVDKTKNKAPSVGGKTIKKLVNHTEDEDAKDLLVNIREYVSVQKILSAFIPNFMEAPYCEVTKCHWLYGNFNIGGTVSGRLSSSNPNLQQIPSGSTYAKLIKECFEAPVGYLMVGLDFNSLEDYISALTTKDPNKLNVYIKKFDGHCLRAANYFYDQVIAIYPELDLNNPNSVNKLKDEKVFGSLRQDSKAPTFSLTYQGTWVTLVNDLGFPKDKALAIESAYHEMYKVSDEYIQAKLKEASETGYVTVAFGLRVRTPMLKSTIWGSDYMPYEAKKEGRTAGNACGQSYCLLNNRAGIEFQERTLNSEFAKEIWPIAHIHDAQYFIIKKSIKLLSWMNKNLVECVQWQELPEIQHDTVKLGGNLGVFYPNWSNEIELPNNLLDTDELKEHLNKNYQKYLKEKDEKVHK